MGSRNGYVSLTLTTALTAGPKLTLTRTQTLAQQLSPKANLSDADLCEVRVLSAAPFCALLYLNVMVPIHFYSLGPTALLYLNV